MKLGAFFKSSPSILLAFDRVSNENFQDILEQVDEVKKYYRFRTLTDYIDRKTGGTALLVFENARKGAMIHVLPVLIAEKVPFTLFLRPECIGTNRLPIGENTQPIEATNPLDYFSTWGKIREFPPTSFDIGINLEGRSVHDPSVDDDLGFIETQLKRRAEVAICETSLDRESLREKGIRAIVTAREGVIESTTSLFDLPRYRLKKKD